MTDGATRATPLETLLADQRAAMTAWQVRALILGALTSTNLRLGPQHLLPHILGKGHNFESMDHAQRFLGALMALWNDLARTVLQNEGAKLSSIALSKRPTLEKLLAYATQRGEELRCFVLGIDAGGDDPAEFGVEGAGLFQRLGEARAFYRAYGELLERIPADDTPEQRTESGRRLCELTTTVEELLTDLLRLGQAIRAEALAAFEELSPRSRTDDGMRTGGGKIGRNMPCPCGSGEKYKRCCGRTVATSH